MALKAGIVGMPNVGKSTLFNAITKMKIEAANYPFATIEPNVGVVIVEDKRMDEIVKLVNPEKIVSTTFEFTDIAGLVKGASQGEGLGNQFLANIRETDAICHVVRCFDDNNIIHVEESVDSVRDAEIINFELMIADLDQVTKRIARIQKKATTNDPVAKKEYDVLLKVRTALEADMPVRSLDFTPEELIEIKHLNLLTLKPLLYIANIEENDLVDVEKNSHWQKLKELAESEKAKLIYISAKIEEELVDLSNDEKKEFLNDLGIDESGLSKMVHATYELLGLKTYFTSGVKEVRAWTFKDGMTAPECAGIIHTDFQKGFIRAEIYKYDDLMEFKSEKAIRENGKLISAGKDYIMKDGDIVNFLFNV